MIFFLGGGGGTLMGNGVFGKGLGILMILAMGVLFLLLVSYYPVTHFRARYGAFVFSWYMTIGAFEH